MTEVIAIENLGKQYRVGATVGDYGRLTEDLTRSAARLLRRPSGDPTTEREFWALRDVSFAVEEGEVVGIVGRNGAGKTTLLKILARITSPTTGRAIVHGRIGSLLEVGTGFHPELSGRENVYLNGAILGMRRQEIDAKFDDIVEFAEVQPFIDTPVKRYSSGMAVRLAFAVAAFLEPEILFIDEVLSVGDQAFQQRCLGRMGEIAQSGRTILYVSHNLASVSALCSRAVLLDAGRVVRVASVGDVIDEYVATVQTQGAAAIEHREDRNGDGRLRVISARMTSSDGGPPRTGRDGVLRLGYRTNALGSRVSIRFSLEGPLGEPLFLCSSEVSGDELTLEAEEGELVCELPQLPLLPGRYSVAVYAEVNGVLADWVRSALFFDVYEDDVFGTGRLPPATAGRVYVNHSWTVLSPGTSRVAS
jgi:homopolymeric O-antigen transport system ATP-binding protein